MQVDIGSDGFPSCCRFYLRSSQTGKKSSTVRFGFCKWGCSLCVVQQFKNSLKYFLLRKDYFPLTPTLTPIGGEGKKWNRFNALW